MNNIVKAGLGIAGFIATGLGVNELFKRFHYNADGYNRRGFDRDGYDREGYDKDGYNRGGFNKDGFDKDGYDIEGYDIDGYDIRQFDRNGRDRNGFDQNGIDAEGYDRKGFDFEGYSRQGQDRGGHDKQYYAQHVELMQENERTAYWQLLSDNYRYALSDIRVGIEQGIEDILLHETGKAYEESSLNEKIKTCEEKRIIKSDFIEKLYSAKRHCNDLLHPNSERKTFKQVYFCYKVLCETTDTLLDLSGLTA